MPLRQWDAPPPVAAAAHEGIQALSVIQTETRAYCPATGDQAFHLRKGTLPLETAHQETRVKESPGVACALQFAVGGHALGLSQGPLPLETLHQETRALKEKLHESRG